MLLLLLLFYQCPEPSFPSPSTVKISSTTSYPNYLYMTLADTKTDSGNPANNGPSEDGYDSQLHTHYLYSPEDFYFDENDFASPLKPKPSSKPLGNRTPVIFVHGWQGSKNLTDPEAIHKNEHQPSEYWANFIAFFDHLDPGRQHYKLFLYRYPSYKHITYNASILKNMVTPDNTNADMFEVRRYKNGFNVDFDKGIVVIAHSMGTLITRSAFEEHELNHSFYDKLFLLAGPHHGTPGVIRYMVNDLVRWSYDLETHGAYDLYWDNHDGLFGSDYLKSFSGKTCPVYDSISRKKFIRRRMQYSYSSPGSAGVSVGSSAYDVELKMLENSGGFKNANTICFDSFYRAELVEILSRNEDVYIPVHKEEGFRHLDKSVLPLVYFCRKIEQEEVLRMSLLPNPWLSFMNIKYKIYDGNYKRKLYFVGGINEDKYLSDGEMSNNNKLTDDENYGIADEAIYSLMPKYLKYGYRSDGVVPLTSQFFDQCLSFSDLAELNETSDTVKHNVIDYYKKWINDGLENGSSFVLDLEPDTICYPNDYCVEPTVNEVRYLGDGFFNHIVLMDFDHSRLKGGAFLYKESDLSHGNRSTGIKDIIDRYGYIKSLIEDSVFPVLNSEGGKDNDLWRYPGYRINKTRFDPLFLAVSKKTNFNLTNIMVKRDYTQRFVDIPANDAWFKPFVAKADKQGWVNGYNDYTFKPLRYVSRSEAMIFLSRALGHHNGTSGNLPYGDVSSNHDHYRQINFAYSYQNPNVDSPQNGDDRISFFDTDLPLEPDRPLTRAEAAHMIVNAASKRVPSVEAVSDPEWATPFTDVGPETEHYRWIMTARRAGLLNGYEDGRFLPEPWISRAEFTKLLVLAFSEADDE